MNWVLPHAPLNLRRNPFGFVPLEESSGLTVPEVELSTPIASLREPGFAVLLMGEAGRGKSTHLRAIHEAFAELPFTYIGEGERPQIPVAPVVFVDECQRLSWWGRRRLFRRPQVSFALTSHLDVTGELKRAGLRVFTRTLGELDEGRIERILWLRIKGVRLAPGRVPSLEEGSVRWLIQHFGSDLRGMSSLLYEVFQALEEPTDVKPLDLDRARREQCGLPSG